MEGLQSIIDLGKSGAQRINPIIEWVSVKVAGFIDVSVENVHLILIGAISMYLAHIFAGRELKLKFWLIAGGLFWLFTYLGF